MGGWTLRAILSGQLGPGRGIAELAAGYGNCWPAWRRERARRRDYVKCGETALEATV